MMRSILVIILLGLWGTGYGQQAGFAFSYTGPTQILVGPNCEAPLQWGHPNTPTASSNLPGGFIVSFTIFSIGLGYSIGDLVPGGTTVTVFYQALDNFGNMALFGFNIAFVDNIPPVFDPLTLPPGSVTVPCHNLVPPPASVDATDNCEESNNSIVTITFSQTNNAQPCTGGTIIRTWVADDDLGNFSTFTQTITVQPDNTPPSIVNNLQNGMAPCAVAMALYTTWLNTQRANFTATDNGCGVMALTDNAPHPATITSFCGVITVTFTATDSCNNSSTLVRTFTVVNMVPPVITTPAADASGNCSQGNINAIFNNWINTHGGAVAEDDCSSVSWTTSPVNPSLQDTCNATITVMFIAGDGCNNFDTTTAHFTITDNTPPVFTTDPTTVVLSCGSAGLESSLMDWLLESGNSAANDLCTSSANLVPGYRIGGADHTLEEVLQAWQDSLISGCSDNVFIGGIGLNNVVAYLPVEFTYTDNCGNTAGKTSVFGITDNGRPQFVTMPVDTAFTCSLSGDWQEVFLTWYNSAGGSTYMDLCTEVTVQQSITADSAIQYLSAALDTACFQGVSVTVAFGLADACGNTSLDNPQATFGLQDTVAPVLVTPASDLLVACSENVEQELQSWLDTLGGATATDGCGDLTWEFSWQDTSGNILTGIPGEGPYPELGAFDCNTGLEVIFTAYDICQNSVSDTALFSVMDTLPPSIIFETDTVFLACFDTIPGIAPDVSDGCDTDPVVVFADSVSIDSCLGLPVWVVRTWTATDNCGNSTSTLQWFLRGDTIPPTFELPSDSVAFCSIDTLVLLQIADNCDPSPVVSWEDETTGAACNQTLTRTWIVTDACGNSATAVQQFDLSDDTGPVIEVSPGDFVYACDTSYNGLQDAYEAWLARVEITDGCSDTDYFIALRESYDPGDTTTWPGTPLPDSVTAACDTELVIEADLVAYDACGNVAIEPISFTLADTTAPAFIDCPAVITVTPDTPRCEALITLTLPGYEEICFPESVTVFLSINGGEVIALDSLVSVDTLLPAGIHAVLWTAKDCKGNSGSCMTELQIFDEDALQIRCPADTNLVTPVEACSATLPVSPPEILTGACSGGVSLLYGYIEGDANPSSFVFDSTLSAIDVEFYTGQHTVFLVAADSLGDHDTCSWVVTVRDTIPPSLTCLNDTVYLHPSGLDTLDVTSLGLLEKADDACGIDSIGYDPPYVHCGNSGGDVFISITAYDIHGNVITCVSRLTVLTQPLAPLWESGLCDDTLRLFANLPPGPDSAGYIFVWTGPNGFVSADENPVIPGADSTMSGTYVLTVTSENGCVSEGSADVLVVSLAPPAVISPADTVCTGEEIVFSTQLFSGEVVYTWYLVNANGDTIELTTAVPELQYTPALPGDYTLFATIGQDTCISAPGTSITFFVVETPVAGIAGVPAFLCIIDTLFLSPQVIIDSLLYEWAGPGGFSFAGPLPPGIPAGDLDTISVFFLKVANAHCTSPADSAVVQVQFPPVLPVISGDTLACQGGPVSLFTQASYGEYHWLDPQGNIITTDQDTLTISPVATEHHGDWRVVVFENGCPSDTSAAFAIQIDTGVVITIVAPQQVCEGEEITLSITPALSGNYTWTGPGGFASNEASPTTTAITGTYSVVLESATGCNATDFIDITTDLRPVILSLVSDATACVNGVDRITLWAATDPPFSAAYEYRWGGPVAFEAQDSSAIIPAATSEASGVYTLFIINGACVSETASITLLLTDSPEAPLITGDTTYCFAETIELSIGSPLPGATYLWSSTQSVWVIDSPGTLTIPGALPNMSGVYQVVVTTGECTSALSEVNITVMGQIPAPSILTPSLVCEGDSLVLVSTAPAGSTSHWIGSNGFESMEDQPVIYPVLLQDAATYQVLYLVNGCSSPPSNPFEIEVQPAIPPPVITTEATAVCIDQLSFAEICLDAGSIIPGGLYTWMLNGSTVLAGETTDSCVTVNSSLLTEGANTVTAFTTVRGCPSEIGAGALITGDAIPPVTADAGPGGIFCPGDVILLQANDPGPATGAWSADDDLVVFSDPADPLADIIGLPPGEYDLVWTLSYATCIDYSSAIVTIDVLPSPITLPDTVEVLFGQTREFVVTINDILSTDPFTFAIIANPQRGNALHAGNGIIRYSPNVGFIGTDMLIYRICSTDCPEECSESVVILRVGNEDDCFIPTLFTPNNDGINDYLVIPCLETSRYPQNKLIVFNEWGDVVLTATPYHNDWDGTVSGQPLPVGTYFFIMDFGDGQTPKRTFLILER